MSAAEVQHEDTEHRLLDAACKIFADKGFHEATVADICREAHANVAAVNYYFRSKEKLYVEAWRRAFHRSIAAHPPDGGVAAGAPPAERLRGRIRSIVDRILDPASYEFDIMHHEHAQPTGLLDEILREAVEPIRRQTAVLVRELLGPAAPDRQVRLCGMSIIGQCFHMMMHKRLRGRGGRPGPPRPPAPMPDFTAAELVDHITRFSLAGIAERRRQFEGREAGR